MKEHPILMQTDMVKAILDGRKTQTRRIIKPQPPYFNSTPNLICNDVWMSHDRQGVGTNHRCPYGQVSDRLWVRETHYLHLLEVNGDCGAVFYKAQSPNLKVKWRPSIHMFRKDSRITLEITEVRVERVQEITAYDAQQEGASFIPPHQPSKRYPVTFDETIINGFHILWDSINAKRGSWADNPWVWVVSFKVVS